VRRHRGNSGRAQAKGAEFFDQVEDFGFGLGTNLRLPGAGEILLYEPRHPKAHSL
jgi:hypothetical protein